MPKKKVEIIEPTVLNAKGKTKLNACAYARVSTDSEEQEGSFNNQKEYYEEKIKNLPNHHFVGIFADRAISGTTDKRPEFQRMIKLAEQGHIDVIFTKSVSRFSRNVSDLLKYCKILREHNVNVIFEENGLELSNTTATLILTLLGAIAQMEVENTSDHLNWTLQNKMEHGKLVGKPNPLGYDIIDGELVINEDEAVVVRYIFRRYLEGIGCLRIAKELEAMQAKTKRGGTHWNNSAVTGILKNEKYVGTLIQGKTYTVSTVDHVRKANTGEARLYKSVGNHEPIISLEDFEKAQEILEGRCAAYADGRRKGTVQGVQLNTFTGKLVCAYCGKNFIRHKVHVGSKYEKIVWGCSLKYKRGKNACPNSRAFDEEYLKQAVVLQIKHLIDDTDSLFYLSNGKLTSFLSRSTQNKDIIVGEISKCKGKLTALKKKKTRLFDLFLEDTITQEDYDKRSEELDNDISSISELLEELQSTFNIETTKSETAFQISQLISEGKAEGFNEELFNYIIDKIVVGGKRSDFVDDPKSLHFSLNIDNLDTEMRTILQEGNLIHIWDNDSGMIQVDDDNEGDENLCTPYSVREVGLRHPTMMR